MEGSKKLPWKPEALEEAKKWGASNLEKKTPDPLSNIASLKTGLDLSNASPNGKSRLLSNVKVTLPILFPNPTLFTAAKREFLQLISQRKAEIKQCGFGEISLAAGIARWNGSSRQMPILVYPLEIEEDGEDLTKTSIKLGKKPMVNPAFIGAMRDDFGIEFDFSSLSLNLDSGRKQFISQVAREIGEMVYGFSAELRFIMGCFINPEVIIQERASRLVEGLNQGKCEVRLLRDFLEGKQIPQRPVENEDLNPHEEKEVGDVPNSARRAARLASLGQCVFLDSPSSSASASLALAIASRCACEGKSVIYSSPLGEQKEAFLKYAKVEGISNLVLSADERNFAKEIDDQLSESLNFRSEEAVTNFDRIADELVGVRSRLSKYFGDLHKKVEPWNLSAYQVLEKLLLLGSKKSRPSNWVRLEEDVAKNLKEKLGEVSRKIERFAGLGGFSLTPQDTPWYEALIFTPEEAQRARERVERVSSLLPQIRRQVASVVKECGFPNACTVEEWGRHVTMLNNLRKALDLFSPAVFNLDFPSILEATKSKEERKNSQTGFWERKRLVKEAKSCLKPGAKVEDLHGTLQAVFTQYQRWRSYSSVSTVTVPEDLKSIVSNLEILNSDLTALDALLPVSSPDEVLSSGNFDVIESKISDLKEAEDSLETLPERESLEKELREMGLEDLLKDLKSRKLDPSFAGDELELAWYASVFDLILQSSPLIASQDDHFLAETARRFVELDKSHVDSSRALVESSCMSRLAEFLYSNTNEANDWHSRLSSPAFDFSLAQFEAEAPNLLRLAKPIIASTPASIATAFPNKLLADVLIIDGCQNAKSADILSLLPLAKTCVVISDLALCPSPILNALAPFMQRVKVKKWARCDERLQEFLSNCGIERTLLPPSSKDKPEIAGHSLSGWGVPIRSSDLVESTNQEADYVAKLAAFRLGQTPLHPSHHLTVIALNQSHAESVAEAIKKMGVKEKCPDLVENYISVGDISNVAAMKRGDVILATGYAKMGDGRLVQQFGRIQEEGGEKLLLSALCLAERRLDVVSSFKAEDLDESRLTAGTRLLKDLIAWAQNLPAFAPPSTCAPSNTLVDDLQERIKREGYGAKNYLGYKDGIKIPLAVGKKESRLDLAVFTDDANFMSVPSMRLRYRGIPDLLRPMGWGSIFAWSVGMFVDPDGETEKIARVLDAADSKTCSVGIGELEDGKG